MTFSKQLAALTLTGTLLCGSALAQTRFCLGGDLDRLSADQRTSCNATLQTVRSVAVALHAPSDWHFVVVCGEEGWKQYAAFSLNPTADLLTTKVDTNLEGHETFLRERDLESGNLRSVTDILAREVTSIQLQTNQHALHPQAAKLVQNRTPQGM